jgi:cytochrome P450
MSDKLALDEPPTDPGDPYYDPYDLEIDNAPYPTWKRLRDEAPLYYNPNYDFYALSRFDDVKTALMDSATYCSGHGTVLEYIDVDGHLPSGMFIFEDPPLHDTHRALVSRIFTPKRMAALEPQVHQLCSQLLDQYLDADGFDFIVDLGQVVPMRVIGMLLGIPEGDQEAIRDAGQERHHLTEGRPLKVADMTETSAPFAEYIEWRESHPSDDLMTQLLNVEFEDDTGTRRRLTRSEVLIYTTLLASAGNETTRRLLGWTGQVLADHPAQRHEIAADRSLIPKAIEELLRFETPSPVQARVTTAAVEHYGKKIPERSKVIILNGSANRDERHFSDPDSFDVHRRIDQHLSFGYGLHFCLGAALARLEGRVVLNEVVRRWTDWEVDYAEAQMDHTSTTRGWMKLPIRTS